MGKYQFIDRINLDNKGANSTFEVWIPLYYYSQLEFLQVFLFKLLLVLGVL
jgi:hypothetical protein